ncbi:hypothetical protein HQ590_10400 [bacterium]|nr:hypothetical protein [bacterium]
MLGGVGPTELVIILFIILVIFVASAQRLYPVGQDRLDLFAYPLLILLAAAALTPLMRPWKVAPCLVVAGLGVLWSVDVARQGYGYPASADRSLVQTAAAATSPEDALVVAPWTSYAVGLYGPWPTELVADPLSTNGYRVGIRRARTLLLEESRPGDSLLRRPGMLRDQLQPVLAAAPRRIVYVATMIASESAHQGVIESISTSGYRPIKHQRQANGAIVVFER